MLKFAKRFLYCVKGTKYLMNIFNFSIYTLFCVPVVYSASFLQNSIYIYDLLFKIIFKVTK